MEEDSWKNEILNLYHKEERHCLSLCTLKMKNVILELFPVVEVIGTFFYSSNYGPHSGVEPGAPGPCE